MVHEEIALFLHNLGYVFGTGGAVLVNIFNVWIDRREQLRPFKLLIINVPFTLVWIGLILMLIVHSGEVVTLYTKASAGSEFIVDWAKAITVYVILVGLGYIKFSLMPQVRRLAPKPGDQPSPKFLSVRKQTRIIPPILLVLWFADFVLNTIWEPTEAFEFLLP